LPARKPGAAAGSNTHVEIHYIPANFICRPTYPTHPSVLYGFLFSRAAPTPIDACRHFLLPLSAEATRVNQMTPKLFCRLVFFFLAQQLLYVG
jgi:hypothetical protein